MTVVDDTVARTPDDGLTAGCCPVGSITEAATRTASGADPVAYVRNLDSGHQALDAVVETLELSLIHI